MDLRTRLWSGAGPFYTDPVIREVYVKLRDNAGSHADAYRLAQRTAEICAGALREEFGNADGEQLRSLVSELVRPVLTDGHKLVDEACQAVQRSQNEDGGFLSLKAQSVPLDQERLSGLVEKVAEKETADEASAKAAELGESFLMHTVDESIRRNAEFQHEVGLNTTIEREAESGCCEWCSNLAGSYRYPEETQNSDVFRRHRFCRCIVTFHSGRRRQDVWSKRTWDTGERDARIKLAEREKRLTADRNRDR